MLSKYVKAGDKLELETLNNLKENSDQGEKKNYRSQVYDIISEDQIKIGMPMEQGKIVLLPVDGEYRVELAGSRQLIEVGGKFRQKLQIAA